MKIVHNLGTLRAMAKAGHIELHPDTGKEIRHWTGRPVIATYVSSYGKEFEYKGKRYGTRIFDGCFSPFVVLLDDPENNKIGFV